MKKESKIKIFLVDDDAVFLKLLEIQFLNQGDFEVVPFATGELCIERLNETPDVIILDFHLDGIDETAINGIETLDAIKQFDSNIPVIMLSSQDKIEVAVQCMHHQATDYVVKSETAFLRLQKIISAVFLFNKMKKELNWYMDRM
jgi:two-component system OmpR family response regulator